MSWFLYRWIWKVESPLYIGLPPAGTLNRCRLYVPSRVVHGAVTAEMARLKNGNGMPDYGKFGHEIALNCRFTYLYPAERINGQYRAWLPKYEKGKGMHWSREDGNKKLLSDREFRSRLLTSIPGTAIDAQTDSTADGMLHETECINPCWRKDEDFRVSAGSVYLLGYVVLKKNGFLKCLQNATTLSLGGDTRYGLGKVTHVQSEFKPAEKVFQKQVTLDKEDPFIRSRDVLGHVQIKNGSPDREMSGVQELVGGWELGSPWNGERAWCPGSCVENKQRAWWTIQKDKYGYWILDNLEGKEHVK